MTFKRNYRILYVCPTAHWAGHYSLMMIRESRILREIGFDVDICTYKGSLSECIPAEIKHYSATSGFLRYPLKLFCAFENTARPLKAIAWLIETFITLCCAVSVFKNHRYDAIYLRDIDPFIFLPFFVSYFSYNIKWIYSLIGYPQLRNKGIFYYRIINAPLWKKIYQRSMSHNRYLGICENKEIKDLFENDFLGGVLKDSLNVLHGAVEDCQYCITKEEARQRLNLPLDKTILLHFGFLHSGKDFLTIVSAAKHLKDIIVVHAGKISLSNKLDKMSDLQLLHDRVKIYDQYITEEDKLNYIFASDAILLSYKKDFIQSASMLWEAAKFKIPVISSDCGYLGEMIRKYSNGLLFEPENADSLINTINQYLGMDMEHRANLSKNHVNFLNDYSEKAWAEGFRTIFNLL
jgi:glycosyltransferase involved in cell wall biosynthesis